VDLASLATIYFAPLGGPGNLLLNPTCHISALPDNIINFNDFEVLAQHWLEGTVP